jgi:hypothetical protein
VAMKQSFHDRNEGVVFLNILVFFCFQISHAAIKKTSMKKLWQHWLHAFWMVSKKGILWSQVIPRKFQQATLKGRWKNK